MLQLEPYMSGRHVGVRLFFTCWVVYGLHFATDIVREIYPALALGDHFSFRLDEYGGMHPDLFETPGRGWHIGNNPGVSMVAAIPYALACPVTERVVEAVRRGRQARGAVEPPAYHSAYSNSRAFYAKAWERGLDVKMGLGALVMHLFCMAPASALGVITVFWLLCRLCQSTRAALWLALRYAFGTLVFFRTGFLNHNLMLGHIAFAGFLAMWDVTGDQARPVLNRAFACGISSGTAVLFDYSGVVILASLFCYCVVKRLLNATASDAPSLSRC